MSSVWLPVTRPRQYDTMTHCYLNQTCSSLVRSSAPLTCCHLLFLSPAVMTFPHLSARHATCSFLPLSLSCCPGLFPALRFPLPPRSFFHLWDWHRFTFAVFSFEGAMYSFVSLGFPSSPASLWYLYALLVCPFSSLCLCVLLSFFHAVSCDLSDHQAVSFDPSQDGTVCLSHSFQPCPSDLLLLFFLLLLLLLLLLSCTPPSEITLLYSPIFSVLCLSFSSLSIPDQWCKELVCWLSGCLEVTQFVGYSGGALNEWDPLFLLCLQRIDSNTPVKKTPDIWKMTSEMMEDDRKGSS